MYGINSTLHMWQWHEKIIFTIVVVVKVLFTVELPSNMNIFTKLVTEILRLLPGQFWYRQEGVDLLCSLQALHLLQGDLDPGDELGREVPGGGLVDEVPLLGVDLGTAGLLSQLSLRHRPGQYNNQHIKDISRDQILPAPDVYIRYGPYVGVFIKRISAQY